MRVTRSWNLAHDRCSTNGEQTDWLPSCSASSCWSLEGPSSFKVGVCKGQLHQGLGRLELPTLWDFRQAPGIKGRPRMAGWTHRGT